VRFPDRFVEIKEHEADDTCARAAERNPRPKIYSSRKRRNF